MWAYNTSSKEWKYLNRIPFVFSGPLRTCNKGNKTYTIGAYDGYLINIILVYNVERQE